MKDTAYSASATPGHSESGATNEDYFSHGHGSANLRQTAPPRTVSFTQMPSVPVSVPQAAEIHHSDGEGSDTETDGEEAYESCATTPGDPFLSPAVTPAITPAPSNPGSTHNLATFAQLAGATASHLSVQSHAFDFSRFGNGGASMPEIPPLPSGITGKSTSGSTTPKHKRESFQAPPTISRPTLSGFPSQGRRPTHRTQTSASTITPPTASSPSLSEKASTPAVDPADLFYLRDVPAPTRPMSPVYKRRGVGSTVLEEGQALSKPWLEHPDRRSRIAYLLTYLVALLGLGASAARCFFGAKSVQLLNGNLCMVLEDNFDGSGIDTTKWSWDVAMDGFG